MSSKGGRKQQQHQQQQQPASFVQQQQQQDYSSGWRDPQTVAMMPTAHHPHAAHPHQVHHAADYNNFYYSQPPAAGYTPFTDRAENGSGTGTSINV